ncbi:carnosine N-methyltransferase [Bombyx mandarina]|uniref:carnosine N-methyltransferase n=1 Tax=Bombyx mandarina TaxID=7092 RepID=A0A6J2JGL8_BOMMA|nr:carnosine N-methyltransferase [Bombyx mandarina]
MSSIPASEEIDEAKEREHFRAVVNAFKYYKLCSLDRIHKSEKIIKSLSQHHQRHLDKYKTYLTRFKKCLDINNSVVNLIIKDVDKMFENVDHSMTESSGANGTESFGCNYNNCEISSQKQHKMQHDVEKVFTGRLSIISFQDLFDTVVRVLVPGAGLGRLAWEISKRGYTTQGNEFSLFMLFASNFVLNRCPEANKYTVHPWLHQYVNNLSCEHQLLGVKFPDVRPSGDRPNPNFSMAAGDFLKVYTEVDEWSCVVTCFFIDCAPNVIEFVERIYEILVPGGIWINLGPLLYHYSDMPTENSVEPPYDILIEIIRDVGFDVLEERTGVKTKYAQNPNSMLQHEYESVFFVCRKPYTALRDKL